MLDGEREQLWERARADGWIPEPEALRLLEAAGVPVVRHGFARSLEEAQAAARRIGFPVVAKVVSPAILHKSDVGGVETAVADPAGLSAAWTRLSRLEGFTGALIAERLAGLELIFGAKIDAQFGPVILFGLGGTAVEIYRDVVTRLAPLRERDVASMVCCLRGARLLTGFRGCAAVSLPKLTAALLAFSRLVMEIAERIEAIDLNPVFCTAERCVVADARILPAPIP